MQIKGIGFTIGTASRTNEDSFDCKLLENGTLIAVVADGVGGNAGGSIASAIAVKLIMDELTDSPNIEFSFIFEKIIHKFQEVIRENPVVSDMATTLTACVINNGIARFAHVGDSRLYHLRANGITQKTKDQTEVAVLLEQGILTPRQAKNYPRKSVLMSALSASGDHELMEGNLELNTQDRLILLTDGAYKEITKRELRDLSLKSEKLDMLYQELQADLQNKIPSDDATVVVIEYL